MTAKTITIIALRLLVVYILFLIIPEFGTSLVTFATKPEEGFLSIIGVFLSYIAVYLVVAFLLYKYSENISDRIIKIIPDEIIIPKIDSVNLLAVLIAAFSLFEIISIIPTFFNKIYSVIIFYQSEEWFQGSEKARLNGIIFGLLGSTIQMAAAILIFLYSKRLAIFWDKKQSLNR